MKPDNPLSARQRQVLMLLTAGCTDQLIALRMRIAERTVRFHIAQAIERLGASTRTQGIALAIRRGWIRVPVPAKRGPPVEEPEQAAVPPPESGQFVRRNRLSPGTSTTVPR